MLRRVPTQSRLCKMRILSSSQCYLCWNGSETLDHLFFECPFSKSIWEKVLQNIHPYRRRARNYTAECQWIMRTFKGCGTGFQIASLAFTGTLYHVWTERNKRHFDNIRQTKQRIVEDIIFEVGIKSKLMKSIQGKSVVMQHLASSWDVKMYTENEPDNIC